MRLLSHILKGPSAPAWAMMARADPPPVCHLLGDDPGILCTDVICEETEVLLCTNPADAPSGMACVLQEGLSMVRRRASNPWYGHVDVWYGACRPVTLKSCSPTATLSALYS